MLRAFAYLLLLAAVALALAWFADRPGVLTLEWLGYEIQTSVFVAVLGVVGLAALLLLVFGLAAYLIGGPRRMSRYMREKRRARGMEALQRGIFAICAGDEAAASRYAGEARRALPNEPLTKLLRAQSAQLSGDRGTARRIFETLADSPETELLGLRGLFLEASREGHDVAARQFAERAVALNPALPWPVHALLDLQCRARDWQGALDTLAAARTHRHLDRRTLDRRRAVLLTAQALDLRDTQAQKALELALEAHRLAPSLVPAANIAGRLHASQGATQKAGRIIARTWQMAPHPDLALAYAYARPGDSPRDRLVRVRSLAALTPEHPEAQVALAMAACDAQEWQMARDALQPLLTKNPTARVCALMARIEGSEKRDAGRVREWLARALRAPRDPVWMADGAVAQEWAPISPVTGMLDAFEWRTPEDPSKGSLADVLLEDIAALGRELEAVALPQAPANADLVHDGNSAAPATHTQIREPARAQSPAQQPAARPAAVSTPDIAPALPAPAAVQPAPQPASRPEPARTARDAQQTPDGPRWPMTSAAGIATPEKSPAVQTQSAARQVAAALEGRPDKPAPPMAVPKRPEPKIFVPERAPDDPGPGSADPDDTPPPLGRYISGPKYQQS